MSVSAQRGFRYAARVSGITGSVIDSSVSALQNHAHDIVRFAIGSPGSEVVPAQEFATLLSSVLGPADIDAYDYGPTEGERSLRVALIDFLNEQKKSIDGLESLLITTGGMQGLDLAFKLFVDQGAVVVTESPTYTNGTLVISGYQGQVLEAPVDRDGMIVDALPELAAKGNVPSVIYVIPNFQNPSGVTLSLQRREALLELAARWAAVIVEDDPYDLLRFTGEPLPSLRQLSDGKVTVIGVHTFSKFLAPGLRVGWVTAIEPVIKQMISAKQGIDTCTNVPMQRLISAFLNEGLLGSHLERTRREYGARKQEMQAALERHLADLGVRWTDPEGGFFLWLTLPEDIDSEELYPIALEEGVAFIPGPAFSVSKRYRNALRLCFASTNCERIDVGIRRLRSAVLRLRG